MINDMIRKTIRAFMTRTTELIDNEAPVDEIAMQLEGAASWVNELVKAEKGASE